MPMITRSEQAGWQVFFEASFSPKPDGRRPGRELPLNRTFLWDGASCHIPSVYLCEEGLVLDVLLQADTDAVKAWIERWGLTPETETGALSPEQEMRIQNENPLHRDFSPAVCLNGQRVKFAEGCSFVWLSLFPEHADSDWAAVRDHYRLDPACCWAVHRFTFRCPVQRMESLSVTLTPEKIELPGPHITVQREGDSFPFTTGPDGIAHTLTVREYARETLPRSIFQDKDFLYPDHCIALGYTVEPPLPRSAFHLADCSEGDRPRRVHKPAPCEPEQTLSATVCVLGTEPDLPEETQSGVIGSADGPTAIFVASPQEKARIQMRCDVSSLYFELPETLEWLMVFQKLPCGPVKRKLL